jgi:uncharacterized membrane protein YbhN (UPF0104 family)
MHRPRAARLLSWGLAIAALAFVAWVVPVRDRCWDPEAPHSTRVAVTREVLPPGATGAHETLEACVLHLGTGDVRIPVSECLRLQCEPGVSSALTGARLGPVLALLALYALGTLAWAARWRVLLEFADIELPLGEVWRISIEAQAGGILLPGGIGGDALRIASVLSKPARSGARAPAPLVVASVLLDRAVGLGTLAALAAALGLAFGGVHAGPLALALGAISIGLAVGLAALRLAPARHVALFARGRLGEVVTPVLSYVRDPRAVRAIAVAVALSVIVAGAQLATIRGLVYALGEVPAAEKWVFVGTAMAFIVAAIPALPGGWGTADAAFVFFFGLAGLHVATALAVSLIYRLFWYLSGVAGALLHLERHRRPPS